MIEHYNARGWKIVEEEATLPDGRAKRMDRIYRVDSVHVLAFDRDGKMLVIREYRPFYGDYIWMLPSGKADKESDTAQAAHRELREETGYRAGTLTHLCDASPGEMYGFLNRFYVATDLSYDPLPTDEAESIETFPMDPEDALQKIITSSTVNLPGAYGVLRYLHEQRKKLDDLQNEGV